MNKKQIPTFSINNVTHQNKGAFYVETVSDVEHLPLHLPYRSSYYGMGIVFEGSGVFNVNLEEYKVETNCIVSIPPEAIKQWKKRTSNLRTLTIFFEKSFLAANNINPSIIDEFHFFKLNTVHVVNFPSPALAPINVLLQLLKKKLNTNEQFSNQQVAHLLMAAFYEYANIYNKTVDASKNKKTRAHQLATEFKYLVSENFKAHRSLKFYAEKLFITAKHLSETVKNETGKSASDWLDEAIMLEAKVLLQDEHINIAQVADVLNFPDQSTFGKYFKNLAGVSPLAYKNSF
jgi:AraC family transcriptional regulator, transcriptional activator of pobA